MKAHDAGKTPAGTHRPIMVKEILDVLKPRKGHTVIDATLGYGGHSLEILKKITPHGKLYGFDVDSVELPKTEKRLKDLGYSGKEFQTCHGNFSLIPQLMTKFDISPVSLVLADLGISSMQLDDPQRGFSYKLDGPLDLRLDPNEGSPASEFLESIEQKDLEKLLEENSDEIFAEEISKEIKEALRFRPVATTQDLREIIEKALLGIPARILAEQGTKPLRRTFQALRIAVNQEFDSLDLFLHNLPDILKPGGRAAILTFHSGEDRRVKKAFQAFHRTGIYSKISNEVIRPTAAEVFTNPRASSAKLRWAVKAIL